MATLDTITHGVKKKISFNSAQHKARNKDKPKESFKERNKRFLHEYFPFIDGLGLKKYYLKSSIDIPFLLIVLTLLSIGLVMMFSASYVSAIYDTYSFEGGPQASFYIKKQLMFALIGIAMMYFVSKFDTNFYKKFSTLILIISLVLLVAVLIFPAKIEGKEEFKRWMAIGPISFQPSEVAKLGIIMFLAWSLEKKKAVVRTKWWSIIPYMALIGVICILIYKENHLSATLLVFGITMIMLFMGGFKIRIFVIGILSVAALVGIVWLIHPETIKNVFESYMKERIVAWLDKDYDPLGSRWQTNQSLNAIGSGGLFGLGLGNSMQKHLYVSEAQNDFVFSIVCEELGFFRSSIIIALFGLLVWRGFVISMNAKDMFASLLTMGIVFQVGLQTILNIAVVTDMIPNTGIGLPFFSYGGTSIVMLLAEMGMVLSVSRSAKLPKK